MKINIGRIISFNALGNIFIILALLFAIILIFHFVIANLAIILILFTIGLLAKRKNLFFVARPVAQVVTLIQNTLDLLKLSYTKEHDMFIVDKTGTKIRISKVGAFSVIQFNFVEVGSQKEEYIADTLVKYQR